jgi:hypothetical protein
LFRLEPDGSVTTLATGLYFANGVTLTKDESALVFAETLARRLSRYWLTGPNAGSITPLVENMSALPDNISTGADGRIWCAMVAPVNPMFDRLAKSAPVLRKAVWRLPAALHPKPEPIVWAVAFDPESGAVVGGVRTSAPDFGVVTDACESGGRLWLGTINYPAVAHVELAATALPR